MWNSKTVSKLFSSPWMVMLTEASWAKKATLYLGDVSIPMKTHLLLPTMGMFNVIYLPPAGWLDCGGRVDIGGSPLVSALCRSDMLQKPLSLTEDLIDGTSR